MLASLLNSGIIGLDIGSSSIKIAVLSKKSSHSYRLEHCDILIYDKECFNENGELLEFDYIQNSISKILDKQKNRSYKVVMGVPHRLITQVNINLANDLALDEQNYQIEVEANRLLPPGISASFDYYLTRNTENTSNNSSTFCVLATPKNIVDDRVDLLSINKKLKPIVVDSDAYAILRNTYLVWENEGAINQVRILLHLGHTGSYMFVIQNQDVIYQQNLVIQGVQLTQTIMRYYDLSYIEAENKKITQTLPAGYSEDVLIPYIENAVIDVYQGIQNFFSTSSLSKIDGIYISGGHSLIDGLATQIAKKTHVSTQLFNPFLGLLRNTNIDENSLRKNMTIYSTAIGLALRGFDN